MEAFPILTNSMLKENISVTHGTAALDLQKWTVMFLSLLQSMTYSAMYPIYSSSWVADYRNNFKVYNKSGCCS